MVFSSFILLICVTLIDFQMLNQSCFLVQMLFVHDVQFVVVFRLPDSFSSMWVKIFASVFISDIGL